METLSRRQFLRLSVTSATAVYGSVYAPRVLHANTPWALLPPSVGDLPKFKILEIFGYGGMSQWENFWVSGDDEQNLDDDQKLNWRGLKHQVESLQWQACTEHAPLSSTEVKAFAEDEVGTPVYWGPATKPLWRSDIFNRCRMVVTGHAHAVHILGIYQVLTGQSFNRPRGAGLGAAIQRHYASLQPSPTPYAYVLAPNDLGSFGYVMNAALVSGRHPGSARPLGVKLGGENFGDLLQRQGMSSASDAIFNELRAHYRRLLQFHGVGAPVRGSDFAAYDAAAEYLVNATHLDGMLGGNVLGVPNGEPCVSDPLHAHASEPNPTRRALELAAYLLQVGGANHVAVIDRGLKGQLVGDLSSPYDTHRRENKNHIEITSANLWNLLDALASVIDPSPPSDQYGLQNVVAVSGNNAACLNLAHTLIVIHTEFNRTPNPSIVEQEDGYTSVGREHYPTAGVAVLIGGPITSRAIQGHITHGISNGESITKSVSRFSPTDMHAALLLAAGIDPLAPDNFQTTDEFSERVSPNNSAAEIRANLKQLVLGVSTNAGNAYKFG